MIRVEASASGLAANLLKQTECHWHITDLCFNMVFLSFRINIHVPQPGADPCHAPIQTTVPIQNDSQDS